MLFVTVRPAWLRVIPWCPLFVVFRLGLLDGRWIAGEREVAGSCPPAEPTRAQRLTEAIAKGDAPEPLIAALRAEEERKRVLVRERDQLAEQGALATVDDAGLRRALRARVADVKGLLAEDVQQGRGVLRALLTGPIVFEPIPDDRRGFRFRGALSIQQLITGEAVASGTGGIRADTARLASSGEPWPAGWAVPFAGEVAV
jgi:hypothetical protein